MRSTKSRDTMELLASPRFAYNVITNMHTVSNIKTFKLGKISNQIFGEKRIFLRFENLKIKIFHFTSNHNVPKLATSIVPGKVVAIPRTLVCIRYTDEKHEKAVNSFEMFFCITSSHCKKKQRALWSKVSYDKRKQFVCYSTSHPLNTSENFIWFILLLQLH